MRVCGASNGQVWTRHLAPAAPAFQGLHCLLSSLRVRLAIRLFTGSQFPYLSLPRSGKVLGVCVGGWGVCGEGGGGRTQVTKRPTHARNVLALQFHIPNLGAGGGGAVTPPHLRTTPLGAGLDAPRNSNCNARRGPVGMANRGRHIPWSLPERQGHWQGTATQFLTVEGEGPQNRTGGIGLGVMGHGGR